MTWKSWLRGLVWSPPERPWWGGYLLLGLGVYFGIWFWRTRGWIYGLAVAVTALLLEAFLFWVLVRRRRSSKNVAA